MNVFKDNICVRCVTILWQYKPRLFTDDSFPVSATTAMPLGLSHCRHLSMKPSPMEYNECSKKAKSYFSLGPSHISARVFATDNWKCITGINE